MPDTDTLRVLSDVPVSGLLCQLMLRGHLCFQSQFEDATSWGKQSWEMEENPEVFSGALESSHASHQHHPLRVSFSLRYSKLELSVLLQKVLAGHLILLLRMENGSRAPTSVRGGCQP